MTKYIASARKIFDRANDKGMARVLARATSAAFLIFALGHVVNFFTQVVLSRQMGKSEYGIYAYTTSWVVLLTVIAGIGLDATALRFVSSYRSTDSPQLLRGFVRRAYQWTFLGAVVVAGLASLVTLALSGFEPGRQGTAFLIALWALPASALLDLQTSISRSLRRMMLAFLPTRVFRYAGVVVGVGLLLALDIEITSFSVVVVFAVSLTVIVAWQAMLIFGHVRADVGDAPAQIDSKVWIRVAVPLMGVALAQELMRRTDILMIGSFMTSDDVAVYNVATRVASMVTFVLAAANSIAAPMISQYYARGDKRSLQRLVTMIAHLTFWPSLAIAIGMGIFADPILGLFGSGFSEGRTPLLILLVGQTVNAGAGSVGYILNMTGHERDALRVYAVSALLNIVAVFVGIQLGGIVGAAIASSVTIMLWNVWLHALAVRHLKVYPSVLAITWRQRSQRAAGGVENDDEQRGGTR